MTRRRMLEIGIAFNDGVNFMDWTGDRRIRLGGGHCGLYMTRHESVALMAVAAGMGFHHVCSYLMYGEPVVEFSW